MQQTKRNSLPTPNNARVLVIGCDLGIGEDFESVRKAIRRYC